MTPSLKDIQEEFKKELVEYHSDYKPYIVEWKGDDRGTEVEAILKFLSRAYEAGEQGKVEAFEKGARAVMLIRCMAHKEMPQITSDKLTENECGACAHAAGVAEERERIRKWAEPKIEQFDQEVEWLDSILNGDWSDKYQVTLNSLDLSVDFYKAKARVLKDLLSTLEEPQPKT